MFITHILLEGNYHTDFMGLSPFVETQSQLVFYNVEPEQAGNFGYCLCKCLPNETMWEINPNKFILENTWKINDYDIMMR